MKRDCYEDCKRDYTYELYVENRNAKGELIQKKMKSKEELEELEFKN